MYILDEDENVFLKCIETFEDKQADTNRNPRDVR